MKRTAPPPQLDFFVSDLVDPRLRDEQATMSCPFLSIQKRKRLEPIRWKHHENGSSVEVTANHTHGMATIWDFDYMLAIASILNEYRQEGEDVGRRLHLIPAHLFKIIRKQRGSTGYSGKIYADFEAALDRLSTTNIKTSIPTGKEGKTVVESWSWIEAWKAVKDHKGRIKYVEVVLAEWFFDRVMQPENLLTIHEDYFLMTGGLERELYRLARRHAGKNESGWTLSVELIHERVGTTRELRKFRSDLKRVVKADDLPEYHMFWRVTGTPSGKKKEVVDFYPREGALIRRHLPRSTRLEFDRLSDSLKNT